MKPVLQSFTHKMTFIHCHSSHFTTQ